MPNNRETLIAEVGTVQLEFMMLSQLTGNPIYGQKVRKKIQIKVTEMCICELFLIFFIYRLRQLLIFLIIWDMNMASTLKVFIQLRWILIKVDLKMVSITF